MAICGISFSVSDLYLLGVCGTLVLILINSHLNRSHSQKVAFDSAALKFKEAFTPTLSHLSISRDYKKRNITHEVPDIDWQLRTAIPIQSYAIEEFRFFVPKRKRGEYQQAWEDYKKVADGGIWIAGFPGMPSEKDPYGFIESKIHAILQFAEVK